MSKRNNRHFWAGTETEGRKDSLCGEAWLLSKWAEVELAVTCGKCSAILGQRRIDAHHAAGGAKLEIAREITDPEATGYQKGRFKRWRYGYAVKIAGVVRAYAVLDGAFQATHWELLAVGWDGGGEENLGGAISTHDLQKAELEPETERGRFGHDGRHFSSKEMAAAMVPGLMAAGLTPSKEELRAIWAERAARYERKRKEDEANAARRAEERQAREARQAAERADLIERLTSIMDGHPLSNAQRDALVTAIERIRSPE